MPHLLIVVGLEWNRLASSAHQPVTHPQIQVGAPGYFDASRFAKILEIPTGQVTRAEGDVQPARNPHYWLDPKTACGSPKASRQTFRNALERRCLFAQRYDSLSKRLKQAD